MASVNYWLRETINVPSPVPVNGVPRSYSCIIEKQQPMGERKEIFALLMNYSRGDAKWEKEKKQKKRCTKEKIRKKISKKCFRFFFPKR